MASTATPSTSAPALAASVEAILFSVDKPLAAKALAEALAGLGGSIEPSAVDAAVSELNEVYDRTGRAFRIEQVAGGYRVMSRAEHATVLAAFHRARSSARLSRAAIETLAVIAYQQPITRARLEAVRGVNCGEVLRSLTERQLIAIVGRAEELGRPMLYGTTKRFLDAFGLASLKDLPASGTLQPAGTGPRTMQE